MATAVVGVPPCRTGTGTANFSSSFRLGGFGVLLSTFLAFLGGVWDIQWHEDVGPDTFFTLPHLFLYAGAAGAGLSSLAVVLSCTWRIGRGAGERDGSLVPILGRAFWAPVGFVVAGCGSGLYLLAGLYDLWWHRVYGFDAVLGSPPHTALGLGDLLTLAGGVAVFALLATRAGGRGELGFAAAGLGTVTAIFLLNSASWQIEFGGPIAGPVDGALLFVGGLYPLALLMVASVVRRPGAATLTGLAFSLLMAGGWAFSSWATPAYADTLGLFVRDGAFGFPRILGVLPRFVLPAALTIDLALALARRRAMPVRRGVMLGAGFGSLLLLVPEVVWPRGVVLEPLSTVAAVASVLTGALFGAVAGWGGWKLGVVLRRLAGGSTPAAGVSSGAVPGSAALVVVAVVAALATALAAVPSAAAQGAPITESVRVVHEESVQVGPYRLSVGFSEWPMRAERSLDIVFRPEGGVGGKTGTVTLIAPSAGEETRPLVRHPRLRSAWGLDIVALPEPGRWSLRFDLVGPAGEGVGGVPITLGERLGPPVIVGWLPVLAAVGAMVGAFVVGWRRTRPARAPETWAWV